MSPGDRLADRFVLERELGRGATGVVWQAWDEGGDRPVALKRLHPHLTGDRVAIRTLEAEAASAGRLDHPGIVTVHGLWTHGGDRLLVSERVNGEPLAARAGAMPLDEAILVTLQVAEAVAFAHAAGRVHGDVRPGNVLLSPTGARLFDFGLASWIAAMGALEGPVPTVRPGETAPEILDGGPPGVPADLYGLGVLLVRSATGELPWTGPTPFAVMGAQRAGAPALTSLPRGLRALARALLDPEPDRRPADAAAVVRALRQLQGNPTRPVGFGGRWFAPIRPLGAWVVHGRDPATGGPAVVREGMSHAGALALTRRLEAEGWEVRASKEALTLADLAWAGLAGVLGMALVPVVGWIVAAALMLRWRSAGVRYRLREALPVVQAPLPPRQLPAGNEVALTAAALLAVVVASLAFFPPLAVPAIVALVWLARHSWRPGSDPQAQAARRGRIETALAEAAALIEAREVDLDTNLGLHGEYLELCRTWRGGSADAEQVLVRAEDLATRARAMGARPLPSLLRPVRVDDADAP